MWRLSLTRKGTPVGVQTNHLFTLNVPCSRSDPYGPLSSHSDLKVTKLWYQSQGDVVAKRCLTQFLSNAALLMLCTNNLHDNNNISCNKRLHALFKGAVDAADPHVREFASPHERPKNLENIEINGRCF